MRSALGQTDAANTRVINVANESRNFARFCLVGLLNTAINYGVYLLLLLGLGVSYLIAGPIGFLSGAITGFFLNRGWTFRSTISTGLGMTRYLAVQLVSLACHWAVQWFAGEMIGVPKAWTQLAGIGVSMFVNFFLLRFFVFNNATTREDHAFGRPS